MEIIDNKTETEIKDLKEFLETMEVINLTIIIIINIKEISKSNSI